MNQKVLKTKAMYRAQTGAVIPEEIGGILDEFGIRSRVAVITVDHSSNMNVAVQKLHLFKIGCFAHALNLGAQSVYAVTSVAKWTSKIRDVIVWMKRSTMAKSVLREKQQIRSKNLLIITHHHQFNNINSLIFDNTV